MIFSVFGLKIEIRTLLHYSWIYGTALKIEIITLLAVCCIHFGANEVIGDDKIVPESKYLHFKNDE